MTLNDYQAKQDLHASHSVLRLQYSLLGIAAQLGHLATINRHDLRNYGQFTAPGLIEARIHLGDMLWYLSDLATCLNIELESLALANLDRVQKLHQPTP